MKIIAFANQKGGTGKTTTTLNVGAGLAMKGKRVLLVDLDPQAHLTTSTGRLAHQLENTIDAVFRGDVTPSDALIDTGTFHLLPSSITLSGAENEFAGTPGREFMLKEVLQKLDRDFDYVLIDCPPSLGLLTVNGLVAADEVYIPLQTEFLAMVGVKQLIHIIDVVKSRLNDKLEITGIIATMYDSRKNLNVEVVEKIRLNFGDKLFNTLIRANVSLAEAPSFGQSIFEYKTNSTGAEDYKALTKEVLKRS